MLYKLKQRPWRHDSRLRMVLEKSGSVRTSLPLTYATLTAVSRAGLELVRWNHFFMHGVLPNMTQQLRQVNNYRRHITYVMDIDVRIEPPSGTLLDTIPLDDMLVDPGFSR